MENTNFSCKRVEVHAASSTDYFISERPQQK